jgi:methylmalonyl-CoA/ethylmalonyl-CoA epimerase
MTGTTTTGTTAEGFGVARIGQIAMTVGDLPRAVAFYRDVLGMRFLFEAPPAMAFFDCGGVRLLLSLPEQAGAVAGQQFGSIIYYAVDDIQRAATELEARGVRFEQPPHIVARLPHADLWMAFLRDSDGHLLAIMSEVAHPAT